MKRSCAVLLCVSIWLCGCSFHDMDPREVLPHTRCLLEIDPLEPIYPWIYRLFTSRHIILTTHPEEAQITLKLLQSQSTKEPISRDYSGLINAYRLRYQADFIFLVSRQKVRPENAHIDVWQKQTYSNNAILAKNDEEEFLWTVLYRRAAYRLLIRALFIAKQNLAAAGGQP